MNRRLGRPHTVAVVMATSLAVATACSSGSGRATPGPGRGPGAPAVPVNDQGGPPVVFPTQPAQPVGAPAVGAKPQLTVTDGTSTVITDGRATTFGSTVTDGAWSPDGSRLVYVDGSGNIATARADGSDVMVLTRSDPKVKRAEPAWTSGTNVVFSERGPDGVWRLKETYLGHMPGNARGEDDWSVEGSPNLANTVPRMATTTMSAGGDGSYLMTYQHVGKHGPEVWIVDYNQREPSSQLLTAGSAPVPSVDGKRVAYIGAGGQLYVRSADPASKARPVQVTFGIDGIHDATFTPDGSRLVFATARDIESVSAKLSPGVRTNPARVEAARTGVPSLRPMVPGAVLRLSGVDPVADAIALSRRLWNPYNATPTMGEGRGSFVFTMEATLVGTGDRNALYTLGSDPGPVLFTAPDVLDPRDIAELRRIVGAKGDPHEFTVRIVGDTKAVSAAAEHTLTALGYRVERVDDTDPLKMTALSVGDPSQPVALISLTDMAAVANIPSLRPRYNIVLVRGRTLPALTGSIIGGGPIVTFGPDAAAAAAAAHLHPITAWNYPDALAESTAIAALDANYTRGIVALADPADWRGTLLVASQALPVILVPAGMSLSPAARTWLSDMAPAISSVIVGGGAAAIPDGLVADATTLVSGPAGATANGLLVW